MALADANEWCKAAILSLPLEPVPTLDDMLQVCARKVPFIAAHQSHSSRVKPPEKAAAADTVPPVPVPQPPPKRTRSHEYYILQLSSHTTQPGPIVEDNARVDALAMAVTIPQRLGQAKLSHDFYHQNARALAKQFGLTLLSWFGPNLGENP
ncbi:hypothetical protein DUI87_19161 [Hirundo rustica rustica]|uniref:Integrase-type domain-containing protein n=1 Tax=Hirundo rustica rustica TaxID=333673 RepID=A0A3M0JTL5_HIRRU|nr:hypothetical protein DUI87_19161 [Hirundo rustica rustica]